MMLNDGQKKLAAIGIFIVACIVALLSFNSQEHFTKHDVLGIVPGMTRDQVKKLITVRKWVCPTVTADSVDCKTDAGRLTVTFADANETSPVAGASVVLRNQEALSFADTVKAVSSQYDRSPAHLSNDRVTWNLDGDLSLVLVHDNAFKLSLARK
jgi:hypothetical protein